jgi:hypothetical protein
MNFIKRENLIEQYKLKLSNLKEQKIDLINQMANLNSDIRLHPYRLHLILFKESLEFKLKTLKELINFIDFDIIRGEKELKKDKQLERQSNSQSMQKTRYNDITRDVADNHKNEYTDDELRDIFLNCNEISAEWFDKKWEPNKEIEYYRNKLKRTYEAIESIVRVKLEYLKTGNIEPQVYWHDGVLDKSGQQMLRILDELKLKNRI